VRPQSGGRHTFARQRAVRFAEIRRQGVYDRPTEGDELQPVYGHLDCGKPLVNPIRSGSGCPFTPSGTLFKFARGAMGTYQRIAAGV